MLPPATSKTHLTAAVLAVGLCALGMAWVVEPAFVPDSLAIRLGLLAVGLAIALDVVTHFTGFFGPKAFHPSGANVCFADGSVRHVPANLDLNVAYALLTRERGETISADF